MAHPDSTYNEASGPGASIVKYTLQPVALLVIMGYWLLEPDNPLVFAITIGVDHNRTGSNRSTRI